jgi:CBS domain-containing protein
MIDMEAYIMTNVSQLLRAKGHQVWSVTPDTTVFVALELMAEQNVGALLVLSDDVIAGIFSERDYARKVILKGRTSKDTPVGDIMTDRVVFVRPDQSVNECMALMTDRRIRHLPVVSHDGKLEGIISIGDVVKAIMSQQEMIIDHLEGYITGRK